jgi:hypothetical protein
MSLDSVPIWGVFVGSFLVVIISIEAGYALGHIANWRKVDEKESPTTVKSGRWNRTESHVSPSTATKFT